MSVPTVSLFQRKLPNPKMAQVRGTHVTGPERGRDLLKDTQYLGQRMCLQ